MDWPSYHNNINNNDDFNNYFNYDGRAEWNVNYDNHFSRCRDYDDVFGCDDYNDFLSDR